MQTQPLAFCFQLCAFFFIGALFFTVSVNKSSSHKVFNHPQLSIVMWSVFYLTILLSFTGCEDKPVHSNANSIFESPKALAELTDSRLMEPSGIASSTVNPGMLWTHNDSGNKPEVYLIDQKLNIKLTCKLKGVINRDWEDIAVGPGPEEGKTYVYVGEIGDNFGMYPFKYIYRFEEPVLE